MHDHYHIQYLTIKSTYGWNSGFSRENVQTENVKNDEGIREEEGIHLTGLNYAHAWLSVYPWLVKTSARTAPPLLQANVTQPTEQNAPAELLNNVQLAQVKYLLRRCKNEGVIWITVSTDFLVFWLCITKGKSHRFNCFQIIQILFIIPYMWSLRWLSYPDTTGFKSDWRLYFTTEQVLKSKVNWEF